MTSRRKHLVTPRVRSSIHPRQPHATPSRCTTHRSSSAAPSPRHARQHTFRCVHTSLVHLDGGRYPIIGSTKVSRHVHVRTFMYDNCTHARHATPAARSRETAAVRCDRPNILRFPDCLTHSLLRVYLINRATQWVHVHL